MKETRIGIWQTVGSLYDVDARRYFRSGTPTPSNGTVALSGYHAYRCLMWCDKDALWERIGSDRVHSVAVSMTSEGNANESAAPCAVRLYRTDLKYDEEKQGLNSADTTRFDRGMTAEMPVNAHMPEWGETGMIGRGETLTDSVFMTGAQAQRLAEALMDGCAIGTFELRSGSVYSSNEAPYHVRYLKDISLTIRHEPESHVPPAPEWVQAERSTAAEGGKVRLRIGYTGEQTGTRWGISRKEARDAGWRDEEEMPCTETVETWAGRAGEEWQWRVRAINEHGASEYTVMPGTVRVLQRPERPRVTAAVRCCVAELTMEMEKDGGNESRMVLLNGEPFVSVGADETKVKKEILIREGENDLSFVLRDARGGESGETVITLTGVNHDLPGEGLCWKGVPSGQMGLTLKSTEGWPRAGTDEATDEGKTREIRAVLYGRGAVGRSVRRLYCGRGTLSLGADPEHGCEAVLKEMQIYRADDSRGGTEIRLCFEAEAFDRMLNEAEITAEGFPVRVVNGGDMTCRPLIRLRAKGDVTLTCGERRLTVYGCGGEVTVDSGSMTAQGAEGELLMTDGEFPALERGENVLTCTGDARMPRVMRRERYV